MSLDKTTVERIAHLARIRLPQERVEPLAAELNNILGWIEQLGEVETEDVAPMASVVALKLRWRADQVTEGGRADDVVANAPARDDDFFAVPKVIE